MHKRVLIVLAIFVFLIPLVAIGGESITVDEQVAQFSRMKPDMGSVFFRIRNNSKTDDVLTGAEVSIKGAYAELHDVKDGNMVKVSSIPVPADSSVVLKRGGLHVMLFNLPVEAKEGDEFVLTLLFEKSGRKDVKVRFSSAGHDMHKH